VTRSRAVVVGLAATVAVLVVAFLVDRAVVHRRAVPAAAVAARERTAPAPGKPLIDRVVVVGHRGDPKHAPEDTVASIQVAFARGAGMVEVDVHLSRDGVPVIIHDDTLDRTTNGRGPVAQKTLVALKQLDAGAWFDRKFTGERVPTLADALRAAAGKGPLLLDLKVDGLGRAVGDVLRQLALPGSSLVIGAWTPAQEQDFVAHVPGAQVLMSTGDLPQWNDDFFRSVRARGVAGFEVAHESLNAAFVDAAHRHRMPVYAFTVNDEPTLRRLISMGVDAIETDDPTLLARLRSEIGRD